jgi:hypothetical protein
VYRPERDSEGPLPVVVYIHGGGWAVGDLDDYDGIARRQVVGAGAVVVSVSPVTTLCATTGFATPNCSRPPVCRSNCTTPQRSSTVT